jgi:pimeloyl-ACP methyl ester carboxylesterase
MTERANESVRIQVGGHALRCLTSGEGERHFLCLHGLVDSLEIWKRIVPALEQRGRVSRIDQRGHRESDSPPGPYSRSDLAGDVIALLDELGVEKTVLVGHSMGGIVAMETALQFPDRIEGLLLIGTTSECRSKVADWYERIALAGESEGCAGLGRSIYGEKSKKEILGDAQGIAHVTRMLKSLYSDPLTPRLKEISCPVLLLVGEKDPMGPKASEIIRDALPEGIATFEQIAERGHWLHIDSHEAVVRAMDAWLEGKIK